MDLDSSNIERFKNHFDVINRELTQVFNSRVPLVEDIGKHTLLGHGKRLRPLLFILSCHLCDYYAEDLYQLSTIFEYIHTASLLHDDVLDNAETRRKRPSANQVWGNHAAVLEGDFLYSKALSIAVRADNISFLTRLTEATLRMTEGQILEFVHTDDWGITKDQYMEPSSYQQPAPAGPLFQAPRRTSGSVWRNSGSMQASPFSSSTTCWTIPLRKGSLESRWEKTCGKER
jgi:octaprenyl-diphosphate synthase